MYICIYIYIDTYMFIYITVYYVCRYSESWQCWRWPRLKSLARRQRRSKVGSTGRFKLKSSTTAANNATKSMMLKAVLQNFASQVTFYQMTWSDSSLQISLVLGGDSLRRQHNILKDPHRPMLTLASLWIRLHIIWFTTFKWMPVPTILSFVGSAKRYNSLEKSLKNQQNWPGKVVPWRKFRLECVARVWSRDMSESVVVSLTIAIINY